MNPPKKNVAGPNTLNLLKLPPWVPPKVLHRPEIHAPGQVVKRYLTGEVMG